MIFDTGLPVVSHTKVQDGEFVLTEHGRLVWKQTPNSLVLFENAGFYGSPKLLRAPEFGNGLLLPEDAYFAADPVFLRWNGAQHTENAGAVVRIDATSYLVVSQKNSYGSETALFDINSRQIDPNWPEHGTAVAYLRSGIWLSQKSFDDGDAPIVRIKALRDDI